MAFPEAWVEIEDARQAVLDLAGCRMVGRRWLAQHLGQHSGGVVTGCLGSS